MIETTDQHNFHFGLFCIPNHHFSHPQTITKFAVFFNHPLAFKLHITKQSPCLKPLIGLRCLCYEISYNSQWAFVTQGRGKYL